MRCGGVMSLMAMTGRWIAGWLKRAALDRRGSIGMILGFTLPVAVAAVAGAVDYSRLALTRSQLQAVADETAVLGASELQLRQVDVGVTSNMLKGVALQRLAGVSGRPSISVVIDQQNRTAEIGITLALPTLILNNIKGENPIVVSSRARAIGGSNPLCLVSLDDDSNDGLNFGARTRLDAPGCTIHGNSDHPTGFTVEQQAEVTAGQLCAAGRVFVKEKAKANATLIDDCPELRDPLIQRTLPVPAGVCRINGGNFVGTQSPDTYCGALTIPAGQTATLQPGIYVFNNARLMIEAGATLKGDSVNLHFAGSGPPSGKGKGGKPSELAIEADKDSIIDLTAPKTGNMAGLLLTTDRGLTDARKFYLNSENARRLLGTIYLPSGDIWLGNGKPIADQSAFTIFVARKIATRAGPALTNDAQLTLVLNTNYHLSDVPVPKGLGNNKGGGIQLEK
jgi:hypothetical protein